MNSFQNIRTTMKEKSGKKLAGFTALTTLLVICIVFPAVLILNNYSKIKLLNKYIHEVPKIINDFDDELTKRSLVFEEDIIARGEIGTRVYNQENEPDVNIKLNHVKNMVFAESVSLIDENRDIIDTTGIAAPIKIFNTHVKALKPGKPSYEIYPKSSKEGEESDTKDGNVFVMFPVGEDNGQNLAFEFPCDPLLEVYNELGSWERVLERMLSGLSAYAFIQVEDEDPVGYPLDQFTEDENKQIKTWISGVFQRSNRFLRLGGDSSYKLVYFHHEPALAILLPYTKIDANILLVVPLWYLISTGVFSAVVLSVFTAFSLLLFSQYVLKRYGSKRSEDERKEFRKEPVHKARFGRFVLLASIGCFSAMLLLLENHSTIAFIGSTKRAELQNDIKWHEEQKAIIEKSYKDIYRTRTQIMAAFLAEYDEYRSSERLRELCRELRADYMMLFDANGKELISSNSYTGFSVGTADSNLSEEYKAMLMGYPYIVTGPERDSYTGKQQIGAAALLTADDEEIDGFLLAVFGADSLSSELKRSSLENTVNTFAVVKGYKAAVINNEDGRFIAHTDSDKIGREAKDYMTEDVYGDEYAGFTDYNEHNTYISGVSTGGKSILFMVPARPDDKGDFVSALMIIALLLVIAFIYCPKACVLCVMAMDEALERFDEDEFMSPDRKNPLLVFASGYIVFFTVLAAITFLTAYTDQWPAFAFVFGGIWSRGVNLFSLWAALFFVSVTLFFVLLLREVLLSAAKQADLRTRTVLKLSDSFIAYATGILLLVGVFYMFGVNTTALLASAGIVSIAVGMGAQSMVSDILAGMFLTIEDSIHMGDVVTVGHWTGRVTDMGIRTTKITDDSQNIMILNNSRISDVINMSRRKTSCVLELEIKRSVSMTETEMILGKTIESASAEMPELYGSLKLDGIYNISQEGCTARLTYECAEVTREAVTKRLQEFFEKEINSYMEKESSSDN